MPDVTEQVHQAHVQTHVVLERIVQPVLHHALTVRQCIIALVVQIKKHVHQIMEQIMAKMLHLNQDAG